MTGRIVIIPFLHGKLAPDGTLVEPDIEAILEKWLERHPEHRGRKFQVIRTGGDEMCLVRVTVDACPELADYDGCSRPIRAKTGGKSRFSAPKSF